MQTAAPAQPKSGKKKAPTPHKNPYLHFSRSRRAAIAAKHPAWPVQQVSAELGRQWKALTPAERKPWVELAQFDKARFQTEADGYVDQQRVAEQPVRLRVPYARKKPSAEPRQPDTAYICFWKSRRHQVVAANPQFTAPEVSKEVGRQWRALEDDERQEWLDQAAQDKLRFQEELARCHPTLDAAPVLDPSTLPPRKPLKDPFAPKPAKTGFQLFMAHNRESFALLDMTLNEFRAEMSQLWQRLGSVGQQPWLDMAQQDQLRYEAEMNAYSPPAYMSSALLRAHKRLEELKRAARGDAKAPKMPSNAYSCFLSVQRRELQRQRPDLKHSEVMREVGVAWQELSDHDRSLYRRRAEQDVERFRSEMEAHLERQQQEKREKQASKKRLCPRKAQDEPSDAKEPRKTRRKRKEAPPRRPKTAYNLMYMSKRAELLATYQMSHNECSALCGRLWRQMSEAEREPYQHMAREDKSRYQAELQSFQAREQAASEVEWRHSPGFRHFLDCKRRDRDGDSDGDGDGLSEEAAAALWRDMSESHRVLWRELANDHSSADDAAEDEEQRQLEESARVMLAARERQKDFSDFVAGQAAAPVDDFM